MQNSVPSIGVHTIDALKSGEEGAIVSAILAADFSHRFEVGLSESDLQLFLKHGLNPPDKIAGLRITNSLDKFIHSQASVLGAYLFHIEPALHRIIQWHGEPDGPKLMRRLGEAIAEGIEATRGEGHLPIDDPRWYAFKNETVVELRALQRRAARQSAAQRWQSREEILKYIQHEVSESIAEFPNLAQNLDSFLSFLGQDDTAKLFVYKQVRAASLFDQWAGWATNRDPEKVRQLISSRSRELRHNSR